MDRHELFTFGLVGWICDPSSNPLKIPKNKIKKVEATQKIRHKCLKGYNDKSREQSTPYGVSRPLKMRINSTLNPCPILAYLWIKQLREVAKNKSQLQPRLIYLSKLVLGHVFGHRLDKNLCINRRFLHHFQLERNRA